MTKKITLGLCFCLIMPGCGTLPSVGLKDGKLPKDIHDKPITMYVHEEDEFSILTPGGAHQGIVGAVIEGMSTPNWSGKMPSTPHLVAKRLREGASTAHRLDVSPVPEEITKAPSQGGIYPELDHYSLSVSTTLNWATYLPTRWQTFQYCLKAYSTLRAPNGEILWQQTCEAGSIFNEDESLQLDVTDFRRDDGKKFLDIVELASNKCADELLSKFK
jgi:hypothetical protein